MIECKYCNVTVTTMGSYKRHCLTKRHMKNINFIHNSNNNTTLYYNDNSTLYSNQMRHKHAVMRHNNEVMKHKHKEMRIKNTEMKHSNNELININFSKLSQKGKDKIIRDKIINNMKLKIKKGNNNLDNYDCEFCEKKLKQKQTIRKHLKFYCEKIPSDFREELLEKHNARKNTKNKILFNKKSLTKEQKSNIATKQYIKNQNNIQQQQNIQNQNNNTINQILYIDGNKIKRSELLELFPMFKECTEHITTEDKVKAFKQPSNYLKNNMDMIYSNPSNQNVFFENEAKGLVGYLDDKNPKGITKEHVNTVIDKLFFNHMGFVNSFFSEVESMLSTFNRKKINEYLQKYEDDNIEEHRRLKKQIYFKLRQMSQEINNRIDDIIINENENNNSKEYLSYSHLKNEKLKTIINNNEN
jgi:hypothetical protein